MTAARLDLTAEEWEALQRVDRGPPEAPLVPTIIMARLQELGLAVERAGRRRVTDRGKQLILKERDLKRR